MNITSSLQSKITLALKVFLMGMVRQFLAHTILTYGLKIPSFLSFIWVWKEVIIAGVGIIIGRFVIKSAEYRRNLLSNQRAIAIIIVLILSVLMSLGNSLFIHGQSFIDFAVSAKFNYIPLIIFIVGLGASYLITEEQNKSIINTALMTIKWVLIFSILRYGILHTIPNILDRIGFSQPGLSIERTAGTPPPSLWLTEFYTGYVRNQWPFGWPLSLGFYLAAMRPLFYGLVLHKKNLSDTRGRRLLYIGIVLSTYSRAARGIFLISSVFIALVVYRKYTKYIITLWLTAFVAVGLYIAWGGKSELFLRTWSDKGHIEYFFQWLDLVKQHWLRWLWAASVGPAANHIEGVDKVFNPENQYMQIWLEYGLLWVLSWILSYITILFSPLKKWFSVRTSRIQKNLSGNTISYMGIGISIISLSIAGMVLHPFVDSSSIYPFMLISGIIYGYYHQYTKYEKPEIIILTRKEKKIALKKQSIIDNSINFQKKKKWILQYIPYLWTLCISLFFVWQTYLTFWIHIIDTTVTMSSIRDILFALGIGTTIIRRRKHIRNFIQQYRFIIIPICITILLNIYYLLAINYNNLWLIAGIKYDIFQFIIIGAWIWLWYIWALKKKWIYISTYMKRFIKLAIAIIIAWILRQLTKNLMPDIFLSYMGYSSPSDFIPYSKPPIYYITGAGGIERLNGLFVGPNTLWFFLILMTSVIYYYTKNKLPKKLFIMGAIIYLAVAILTLSRGAIIGITVQILFLLWYESFILWSQTLSQSSKLLVKKIPYFIITIVGSLIALFTINIRKNDSNTERTNSWSTISQLLNTKISMLGYGPGYVGPAKHYDPHYLDNQKNDYAMLENIYLQILINQGWIGLLLFLSIFGGIFYIHYCIKNTTMKDYSETNIFLMQTTQYMGVWLLGLLSIGLFLHIFIDSMVIYLFLLPYSLLLWYTYKLVSSSVDLSMK